MAYNRLEDAIPTASARQSIAGRGTHPERSLRKDLSMQGPGGPIKLDNRPLYARAIDALRALIESEQFKTGDRLPSEELLAKQLGISRSTLREAMGHLETQGAIVRRQGVGTFVADPVYTSLLGGIEQLESLQSRARKAGFDVRTEERRVSQEVMHTEWSRELGEYFQGDLLRLETVQSVNGRRMAYFDSYLPLALSDVRGLRDFEGTAIEYINRHSETTISHTRSGVFAIRADPSLAVRLGVEPDEAILHLKEIYFTARSVAVGVSLNYFLTEAFHFYVIRQVIQE